MAVKQVDVPSFSGSFGILPKHVPTLAVLKPGVVSVFENEGAVKKIFVSSGTVTINDDSSVQIIAEEAVAVDQLDSSAARDVLSKAQSELSSASTDQVMENSIVVGLLYNYLHITGQSRSSNCCRSRGSTCKSD